MRFTYTVDGVEEFNRGFNRITAYISDFTSLWPEVAKEFYGIEREQFDSIGAKGASGKWAALSKAYAVYKAKKYPGKPILQATGSLFASMTGFDAADSIFRPTATDLTIGTQREGAIYHQRETSRMPMRKVIDMTDDGKRRLQKAIQKGLVAFVRRQGFAVTEGSV